MLPLIPLPLFCLLLITYDDYSTFTCVCALLHKLSVCTCVSASRLVFWCPKCTYFIPMPSSHPGLFFSFRQLRASLHYLLFTSSYIFRDRKLEKSISRPNILVVRRNREEQNRRLGKIGEPKTRIIYFVEDTGPEWGDEKMKGKKMDVPDDQMERKMETHVSNLSSGLHWEEKWWARNG